MYPTRKAMNDAPVRVARKTLAQAGARTISATTNAQTRTVVMMIAGRSGVDLYAGAFSARCSSTEPSEDMLVFSILAGDPQNSRGFCSYSKRPNARHHPPPSAIAEDENVRV